MNFKRIFILLIHAFIGWLFCAATMGFGMQVFSMDTALIVHAIGAPIFFTGVSYIYYRYFNLTSPFKTAMIFLSFVVAMDFFLVALVINRSLGMFTSLLGTWLPFALIFLSTYLTGLATSAKKP